MQTGQRLEAVGTLLIGDNYRSFVFEKYPLFEDSGRIVGTVFHLKPFERLSMGYFLENHSMVKRLSLPHGHLHKTGMGCSVPAVSQFTKKSSSCILGDF